MWKLCLLLLFSWQKIDEFDEGTSIVIGIKKGLLAKDGDGYWENLRDAQLPWFRAKVLSAAPKSMVRQMVLAIEESGEGDLKAISLKPMCRTVDVGSEVVIRTIAKEFRREPFLLTLEATAIRGCPK